ncbi:RNA methyltransferase [Paenibacillaceae bacterium]|nr:RNA methyltransferase [Paenibacillaceae bacterium]
MQLIDDTKEPVYLYCCAYHEDEEQLCRLELRMLHTDIVWTDERCYESSIVIEPGRSAFVKERLAIARSASSVDELLDLIESYPPLLKTFKVVCLKTDSGPTYEERLRIARLAGGKLRGQAEMRHPGVMFGIAWTGERWLFGELLQNEAGWERHQDKPQHYSTALSAKLARCVVNIAAPQPEGIRVIDPCCGIGTVLLEAMALGIAIIGSDRNPLAVRGARANLLHYGYPDIVRIADLCHLSGDYDVAIIDLPYNVCSVMTEEELQLMLDRARAIARRAVFVTVEPIDMLLKKAGWKIVDRCLAHKSLFARQIVVCQ